MRVFGLPFVVRTAAMAFIAGARSGDGDKPQFASATGAWYGRLVLLFWLRDSAETTPNRRIRAGAFHIQR